MQVDGNAEGGSLGPKGAVRRAVVVGTVDKVVVKQGADKAMLRDTALKLGGRLQGICHGQEGKPGVAVWVAGNGGGKLVVAACNDIGVLERAWGAGVRDDLLADVVGRHVGEADGADLIDDGRGRGGLARELGAPGGEGWVGEGGADPVFFESDVEEGVIVLAVSGAEGAGCCADDEQRGDEVDGGGEHGG